MPEHKWNDDEVPDLSGKTAIVTGSNTGIGYRVAEVLAGKNANVIMACRRRYVAATYKKSKRIIISIYACNLLKKWNIIIEI